VRGAHPRPPRNIRERLGPGGNWVSALAAGDWFSCHFHHQTGLPLSVRRYPSKEEPAPWRFPPWPLSLDATPGSRGDAVASPPVDGAARSSVERTGAGDEGQKGLPRSQTARRGADAVVAHVRPCLADLGVAGSPQRGGGQPLPDLARAQPKGEEINLEARDGAVNGPRPGKALEGCVSKRRKRAECVAMRAKFVGAGRKGSGGSGSSRWARRRGGR
jgi:hypothetical protein